MENYILTVTVPYWEDTFSLLPGIEISGRRRLHILNVGIPLGRARLEMGQWAETLYDEGIRNSVFTARPIVNEH